LIRIDDWKYPTTGKQIQRHLGVFNFFRDVIPLYSRLSSPLDALRNSADLTKIWTSSHAKAYDQIRAALHSQTVLSFPDFSKPFKVGTDASDKGLGAILYQDGDTTPNYICFAARSLTEAERGKGYSATKRELAAVVFALSKFRYYIWGSHFTLYTDHKALTFLFTQRHVNPMLNNWLDQLLDYNFSIVHLPGVMNVLPDQLSRLFDADLEMQPELGKKGSDVSLPIKVRTISNPSPESDAT
jgi:hypothetical protein